MNSAGWDNISESPKDNQAINSNSDIEDFGDNFEDTDEDKTEEDGVWSADIEQSFQEALAIYPPCGRRKIILSDEGKMYGRNELIARYIKLRTGKTRTRKQVSSHIQVLARRRHKESNVSTLNEDAQVLPETTQNVNYKLMDNEYSYSNAGRVSINQNLDAIDLRWGGVRSFTDNVTRNPLSITNDSNNTLWNVENHMINSPSQGTKSGSVITESNIVSNLGPVSYNKLGLHEIIVFQIKSPKKDSEPPQWSHSEIHEFVHVGPLSNSSVMLENIGPTFLEPISVSQIWDKFPSQNGLKELVNSQKKPCFFLLKIWIDMHSELLDDDKYRISIKFKTSNPGTVSLNTKICTFTKAIVEDKQIIDHSIVNDEMIFSVENYPICDYLKKLLIRLKQFKDKETMNSVLENFSIFQVVRNMENEEILLCLTYLFCVASRDSGNGGHCQYRIYSLVNN